MLSAAGTSGCFFVLMLIMALNHSAMFCVYFTKSHYLTIFKKKIKWIPTLHLDCLGLNLNSQYLLAVWPWRNNLNNLEYRNKDIYKMRPLWWRRGSIFVKYLKRAQHAGGFRVSLRCGCHCLQHCYHHQHGHIRTTTSGVIATRQHYHSLHSRRA